MVTRTAVQAYASYMDSIESVSGMGQLTGEDYLQVLSPAEASDLLTIRDEIHETPLSAEERREVGRLDELLVKHRQLITDNLPEFGHISPDRWWWHLHQGPQVREQALKAS